MAGKTSPGVSLEKQELDLVALQQGFNITRNDPYDKYKVTSEDAIQIAATLPPKFTINQENYKMLEEIASNLDHNLKMECYINPIMKPIISDVCQMEIDRLPTWLQSMIEHRFNMILGYFGPRTHHFLNIIANRIDGQYRTEYLRTFGADGAERTEDNEDIMDEKEISTTFYVDRYDLNPDRNNSHGGEVAYRVAYAVGKWKYQKTSQKIWAPHVVKNSEAILRTALLTKEASNNLKKIGKEETIVHHITGGLNEDQEHYDKETHWDAIASDREAMEANAAKAIASSFKKKCLSKEETKGLKLKQRMLKKRQKVNNRRKINVWSFLKKHSLYRSHKQRKSKKKLLQERGMFRRYSRIWYKDCGEPIHFPKRLTHHDRFDESFHAYITALVTWKVFKTTIMLIILLNAVKLGVETTPNLLEQNRRVFMVLDHTFLSIYTVEFMVKIYAHPYGYWRSGFNIFDFMILVVSLTKTAIEWSDWEDIEQLKMFLMLRALRVLRGVSLSVQMQVLMTALVHTIKSHVLSVTLLLVLLIYIASLIALNLFGSYPGLKDTWGEIPTGMVRLFSFVTMDGWTDILEEFEDDGKTDSGRIFCLICIVLGNFLFSNIFIAIIIMNISEATDAFREKQRDERDYVVAQKKDIVFRRQKLDLRQLLARQRMSISADFFHMGSQFQRLLCHDDLVQMDDICNSPLWMDCIYKAFGRCGHAANILMNMHREMADTLLELYELYKDSRYEVESISLRRYNRYMRTKAQVSLLKEELYQQEKLGKNKRLQIRLP